MLTQNEILTIISQLPFQVQASSFEMAGELLIFTLTFSTGQKTISFKVTISPLYPFHYMGQESISFFNENLKEYSHIMEEGNLCMHTPSDHDAQSKFHDDVIQLHDWVVRYYINGEKDLHYEDIVVNESKIGGHYMCYAIPLSERPNLNKDFGIAFFKTLSPSIHHETVCANYLVYAFQSLFPKTTADNIPLSSIYRTFGVDDAIAPFVILKSHPSDFGKFAIKDIPTLSSLMTQEQLQFICHLLRENADNNTPQYVPIFIGYPTVHNKIGWLSLMIERGNLPWHGEPEKINGIKTGKWLSIPNKGAEAVYAKTEILTPELYYGRGAFPTSFVHSKILILGLGAIGSILTRTLAKCGCRNLTIYDFDVKAFGNCCRSEYDFHRGYGDKQNELSFQLAYSHPFVDVHLLPHDFDTSIKAAFQNGDYESITKCLDQYNYIFDCTTDDDLAYILDQLQISCEIINLSISNHANQLVCGFSPKISEFLNFAFSKRVKIDENNDLYNPTGCWNPTFKASYNDINSLLQYAIKRIVRMISAQEPKHNFILSDNNEGIKIERI